MFFYLQFITKDKKVVENQLAINKEINNAPSGLPKHLQIPAIGMSANIEQVGVAQSGEMEVPSTISEVGWYSLGTKPGAMGSAVVSGHLNGISGEDGVFSNLNKLTNGDKILVIDDSDNTLVFIVTGSRTYKPGYAEEVFTKSGGKYLNLITCYGVWNKNLKSYSNRYVVFSMLEDLDTKPI